MEQASNDTFSKKYKKYNLHDKEKTWKIMHIFPLCTIILLSTIIWNLRVTGRRK